VEPNDRSDKFFLPNFCAMKPGFFLILFSQLVAIIFVLVRHPLSTFPWQAFTFTSIYVLWITVSTACLWCFFRNRLKLWKERYAAMTCFIIPLIITAFYNLLGQYIIDELTILSTNFRFDFLLMFQHIFICAIISGLILRYLYLSDQLERQQHAELLHRLQALQSRIQPHFLFNSMNIIASLIEIDPDRAEKAVEHLSEVFRATLTEANKIVPMRKEIDLCQHYLELEQLRLGNRLKVNWQTPKSMLDSVTVPMLTLQPLLENAIYHGIEHLPCGGTVSINIKVDFPQVQITVSNPVPKSTPRKKHSGHHIAIDNIINRMTTLYGQTARLLRSQEQGIFQVTIQYNLKYQATD